MNAANLITCCRVALIPVFMFLYNSGNLSLALALFVISAVTDFLDGYIARKYNQVTVLGAFLDPLADKLMVVGALLCLIQAGVVNSYVAMVIISREFVVTGYRLIAAGKGVNLAAGGAGKLKTFSQIAAIIMAIALQPTEQTGLEPVSLAMLTAATLTVYSGALYIYQNKGRVKFN